MRLEGLGERGAIEVLKRIFDRGHPIGIGDDCALIDWGDQYLLVTTDLISQRAHLPPTATPYQIGWYLVATNLSDVAAMGGYPLGFVAALAPPPAGGRDLLRGPRRGMEGRGATGGGCGRGKKERVLLRTGGGPGDAIVVTGDLGRGGWGARQIR